MKSILVSILAFFSVNAIAGGDHSMPAPSVPKEFESLKALVGTWQGKTIMNGKEESATVSYKLTSGGTAIVETLGEGTPHEMVTVYSARKNKIFMTHYCAIGNQPEMSLKKAAANSYVFEMNGHAGIDDPKEMHMHALTLTLTDPNHLKQEWTNFNNNKKADIAVFDFTRKM
jgi:hypothetical protein